MENEMAGIGEAVSLLTLPGLLNAVSPTPEAPSLPTPPPAVEPPPAPAAAVTPTAQEEAPVVDVEAARVRAAKRRSAAEQNRLISLNSVDDGSVVLTKSLLGG